MSSTFGFIILKTAQIPTRVHHPVFPDPVNADQAIKLLNSFLTQIGMQALESTTEGGAEGRTTLRIVTLLEAKKAQIPVFRADPEKIPTSDNLITQIIPLTNIDAIRTRNDLLPFISADADSAANPGSNTIIITDTAAKIHRLVEMIQLLDHQKSITLVIEYRALTNSNAADAARLINAMFSPANPGVRTPSPAVVAERGVGSGAAGGRVGAAGGRAGGGGGGGTSTGLAANLNGRIYADSDARTNTVILNGPPDQVDQAQKMLTKLDSIPYSALDTSVFFIKHLRNTQAADISPVLNAIFGNNGNNIGGALAVSVADSPIPPA